jgi:hypothetical protein
MLYIALNSDAKTHIASDVIAGPESRIVKTACGLVHPEGDFTFSTEDDSNVCSRCSGKVDVEEVVDTVPEPVVDSEPEAVEEKTAYTPKYDK